MASRGTDPVKIMTTTETDLGALRTDLQDWFRAQAGDPELRVEDLSRNGSSGMSSVTVLFTTVQTNEGMRPAAVLDWEMTTVGPAELDLSWFILFHQIYQDLVEPFGKPGLPDFLRPADVVREYEELSGRTLADMPLHVVFAAMRGAVTGPRQAADRAFRRGPGAGHS